MTEKIYRVGMVRGRDVWLQRDENAPKAQQYVIRIDSTIIKAQSAAEAEKAFLAHCRSNRIPIIAFTHLNILKENDKK